MPNISPWRPRHLFAAPFLLVLGGCVVGPAYRPPPAVPAGFDNAAPVQQRAATAAQLETWWQGFGDAGLSRLIEEALRQNLDLAAADARIAQSRAALQGAGATLLPQVDAKASSARVGQSLLDPTAVVAKGSPAFERDFTLSEVGAAASWELDLFGGNQRSRDAARFDLETSRANRMAVQVAVTAETADAYLQLRGAQARLAVARQQEETEVRLTSLIGQRVGEGLAAERELRQSKAAVEAVRASIPPLLAGIQVQLQRLNVLVGGLAAEDRVLLENRAPLPAVPGIALSDGPADLLRRRPDIIAAERRLAASNARIGASMAEYYPKLSLSALFGVASIESGRLFSADAAEHQWGIGLRWRLFDFGRVDAEVAAAQGRDAELLAAYRATALRATSEVEVALSDLLQSESRSAALQRQVDELGAARSQVQDAYLGGAVSLVEVLDVDRSLLAGADQLALSQANAARAAVSSFRALGGGWTTAGSNLLAGR